MFKRTPTKKERHRQAKVSRDEPYARASDEDLIRTCLSGGRPVLKQSVSVPERKTTKSTTLTPTASELRPQTLPPQEPLLTRSFSAGYNVIPNTPPVTQTLPPQEPLLTRSFSAGYNVIPNTPPVTTYLSQSHFDIYPHADTAPRKNSAPVQTNFRPNDSGIFTFKPLEARFEANKDFNTKIAPYCKFKLGSHQGKTAIGKNLGYSSVWSNAITLERRHCEEFAKIKVKDNNKFNFHNDVGEARIPLNEIATQGKISKWYPIYKKSHLAGQVLLSIDFESRNVAPHF